MLRWFVDITRLFDCMNDSDLTSAVQHNILRAAQVHGTLIGNDLPDFGNFLHIIWAVQSCL